MNFSPVDFFERSCPLCERAERQHIQSLNDFQLVKCTNCGMAFISPSLTDDALERLYRGKDAESTIALYNRLATPAVIHEYDKRLDLIESLVPRGRLLDYGCAAGHFFERAQLRGWDAHGCDLADWPGAAAKQ